MAYLVAPLVSLRAEIDQHWPNRTRAIDGWYRDPRVGISKGHNPDGKGAVHAIDVDRRGIDPMWIVNNIYRAPNVLWYIIWNRTLYSNTYKWVPRAYTGSNPHTDHMHIEVYQTAVAERYSGPWRIGAPVSEGFGSALPEQGFGSAWDYLPTIEGASAQQAATGRHLADVAIAVRQLRN